METTTSSEPVPSRSPPSRSPLKYIHIPPVQFGKPPRPSTPSPVTRTFPTSSTPGSFDCVAPWADQHQPRTSVICFQDRRELPPISLQALTLPIPHTLQLLGAFEISILTRSLPCPHPPSPKPLKGLPLFSGDRLKFFPLPLEAFEIPFSHLSA